MKQILQYFSDLTIRQKGQFLALADLYQSWNRKINVISRKDIDHLYERHVLHALSIAKFIHFVKNSKILDIGTGGGFPGIPLAILFPESQFTLIDGRAKKIRVVSAISATIGLENVIAIHKRAEEMMDSFDFIVSRAVTTLPKLHEWGMPMISRVNRNSLINGLIVLKGGDIKTELTSLKNQSRYLIQPISDYFTANFFSEKYIIYLPLE